MNNHKHIDSSNDHNTTDAFSKGEDYKVEKAIEPFSNSNIVELLDNFIEQVQSIRRTILGVSLSALVLAPFAISLSIYLLTHPSFFLLLERENEFGIILAILLFAIMVVSFVWISTGVWQYKKLGSWNRRYKEYRKERQEIDKRIASQFDVDL